MASARKGGGKRKGGQGSTSRRPAPRKKASQRGGRRNTKEEPEKRKKRKPAASGPVRKRSGGGGRRMGRVGSGSGKKPVPKRRKPVVWPVRKGRPTQVEKARKKKPVTKKPVAKKRSPKKTPVKKQPPRGKKRPVKKQPPSRVPRKKLPVPKKRPKKPPKKEPESSKPPKPPEKIAVPSPGEIDRSKAPYLAEHAAEEYLSAIQLDIMGAPGFDLDCTVKSFVNKDGTMDADLRIKNLPEDWKTLEGVPYMVSFLSEIFENASQLQPQPGGNFWISFGVRFGPSNESEIGDLVELYKRFRGLFQVLAYPLDMGRDGGIHTAIVAMEYILKSLMEKRGLPPSEIIVRITWMPWDMKPGRYKGEKGGGD